jgi:hypothetical protein
MHKSATKCNETVGKWCKNKHGASKIIDTLETYHGGTPYKVEVYYDGNGDMYFRGAGPNLQRIMICIKGSLCCLVIIVIRRRFTSRSSMVHNPRRSMKLKCCFTRYC